jgi:CRP-like cAMP-binding protein
LGTGRGPPAGGRATSAARGNQVLKLLPQAALKTLDPAFEFVDVGFGESLFEAGDDVAHAYFPLDSTVVTLVLPMRVGRTVEAATIGREGSIGGIASLGLKPAFARAAVQIPGSVARIPLARLEAAKRIAPEVHDVLARYTDCLTAQVLQSVGCATLHPLEARCARWLLMTHDRLRRPELPLTQESLAQMFGAARTYMTRIAAALQDRGAIAYRRGIIRVVSRSALEEASCECYRLVRRHFERVLPGLYPTEEL